MKRSMIISLIGRPNVGKSSLFNRLMKKAHKTITYDQPGVTRDRHYGIVHFDEIQGEEKAEAILVDTGGFYPQKVKIEESQKVEDQQMNSFFNEMTGHAKQAINESDLVLLVCDVREGLLPYDKSIAEYIRSQKKKFWVLANKFDSDNQWGDEADFYTLGLNPEELFVVSAAHGLGEHDLKSRLHHEILAFNHENDSLSELQKGVTPSEKVVARMAIVGAPNAGKSTLMNKLLGAERALVSDIAGTTVDPIEGFFELDFGEDVEQLEREMTLNKTDRLLIDQYEEFRKNNPDFYQRMMDVYQFEEEGGRVEGDFVYAEDVDVNSDYENVFDENEESEEEIKEEVNTWRSIHIIDTAGIRKQKSVKSFVESQSVFRALRSITESDIVVYMVDVEKGIAHQDRRLIDIALEKGKSIIVCLNKMDLIADRFKNEKERKEWLLDLRAKIPWLDFCELVPMSAKKGHKLARLKKVLKKTILVRRKKIPTSELNRFVFELIERNPITVARSGGKRLKVKYASMIKMAPPTVLLFSNLSKGIPDNFRRYLQSNIRGYFDLYNTPVHLIFRTGTDLENRMKKIK